MARSHPRTGKISGQPIEVRTRFQHLPMPDSRREQLLDALASRILIIDGAMGSPGRADGVNIPPTIRLPFATAAPFGLTRIVKYDNMR